MSGLAYVNGRISPIGEASIPIEDRGLQFGDSVYEVVHAVNGRFFRLLPHLQRLEQSARTLSIRLPLPLTQIDQIAQELLIRLEAASAILYIQITRGVAPRQHLPPPGIMPTLIMTCRPWHGLDRGLLEEGVVLVTHPDIRWAFRHVKATTLLANILARQEAANRGAYEALLIDPGAVITECSAASFFCVIGQQVRTHPATHKILRGITRDAVLALCAALRIPYVEEPVRHDELPRICEAFITGTGIGVVPVRQIDGHLLQAPGTITRRLQRAYDELVHRETTEQKVGSTEDVGRAKHSGY